MVYELQRTYVDWEYHAERSRRHSLSTVNGVSWPRGLVLGGSGTINALKYVRGNQRDYDQWEQLGNPGWDWENVVNYFKKSEDNKVPAIANADGGKWHGIGGYLSVDYYDMSDPMNRVLMATFRDIGFKKLLDMNADEYVGYGRAQFTIVNGTRCSPAKAFLSSIRERKNLHVIKHAFATSLSFATNDTVQGVNFVLRNKYSLRAIAKKEVILSAGTVNTPKLLMLSGIGQQPELMSLGIQPRVELNVGENLQDHVIVPLFFKFNRSARRVENLTLEKVINLFIFSLINRRQPLTTDVSSVSAFANTINADDPFPDVQFSYQLFKKGGSASLLVTRDFGFNRGIRQSIHRAELEADVVMGRLVVLNPKSRGKISLASTDPYVDPAIDAGYFNVYDDLTTLIRAIRIHEQMLDTKSFRRNDAEIVRVDIPACRFIQYATDEYWECYIRHLTNTMYHPAGTCKMGPEDDPDAVVDSRLKVKHVKNMRVIDASIMPLIVSGNLNAPTIMIGEKGADFIKEDYDVQLD